MAFQHVVNAPEFINKSSVSPLQVDVVAHCALVFCSMALILSLYLLWRLVAIFIAGACSVGAQFGANAVTATLYPTSIRANQLDLAMDAYRFDHRACGWGASFRKIWTTLGCSFWAACPVSSRPPPLPRWRAWFPTAA